MPSGRVRRALAHAAATSGGAEQLWLWLALMVGLTIVNYGYPIAQLMVLKETNVPAVYVGASR